jgi:hypothetical protein
MNKSVLLGFGDSWAWGADLKANEKPYIQLMADHFQVPFINFATPSSSIPHMITQFREFLETVYFPKNEYYAVFFLTAKERTFVYDQEDKKIKHLSPSSNSTHEYYRIYNNELGDFNLNTTILALQRLCSIYDIKDYYVPGWQINKLWKEVDHTKVWGSGNRAITQLFSSNGEFVDLLDLINRDNSPYFGSEDNDHKHPNQQGHIKIAQELSGWIDIDRL